MVHSTDTSPNAAFRYVYNALSIGADFSASTLLVGRQEGHPIGFSRTTWVSRYQKGRTSLDLNEARDVGFWDGSGISWTICKQSALRSRQITTPTPHHSIAVDLL